MKKPVTMDKSAITAPIIAWHGDQDALSDFADLETELAGLNLTSRIFPGCGSALLYEYWEEVLGAVAAGG